MNKQWLRRFHGEHPGAPRLVCMAHAGGAASTYFTLSQVLAPEVEVVVVQYPGRQERRSEPFITEIAALAECVADAVDDLNDAPLALFGHSMGAAVAYEAARILDHGRSGALAGLFASGRRAPSVVRPERVRSLDDEDLIADLRLLNGTPASFLDKPELRDMIMPAIRNDYGAIMRYEPEPGPPLGCPVIAVVGRDDAQAEVSEVEPWREVTTGPFELHVVEGGHFYLASSPDAAAAVVRQALTPA